MLLLAGALASLLASFALARSRLWAAPVVAAAALAAAAAGSVLVGGSDWDWRCGVFAGRGPLHFRLDGISAFFLLLLSAVGSAGAVYAGEYWTDGEHPRSAGIGRLLWSAMLLCMGMVLLAANGLQFLMAWELFAVSAYFLITLDRQRREAREAGWLYLAASHTSTLCLFALFSILAFRTGSWELGSFHSWPGLAPLFWVALFAFGLKAGLFPLHIWLPSAHANAPSHVSAILSGVAIKLGVYGIVRFSGWLPVPDGAGWTV
ncbi:MAG: hypothetical protein M0Q93_10870, partial [Terrimicrobiaceae bacterium]|nr:hypothetical protein [Terrimicrobiaceae bacterium]